MTLPFDEEIEVESIVECHYSVDVTDVRTAEQARHLVAEMQARAAEGRRLRPDAEHVAIVVSPDGLPREVRRALFPAIGEGFDELGVRGHPSWVAEDARLARATWSAASWDEIARAYNTNTALVAKVTGVADDALLVDVGQRGVLPAAQLDLAPPPLRLAAVVGRRLEVSVVRFHTRTGDLVVSRRARLERERDALSRETLQRVAANEVLRGRVTSIAGYGAYVDLGGVKGLVHVSTMPGCPPGTPPEVVGVGDEVSVAVVRYRTDTGHIELRLIADPS